MDNLGSISNRLIETGRSGFEWSCGKVVEKFAPFCESQIEVMLLGALHIHAGFCQLYMADREQLVKVTQEKEIDRSFFDVAPLIVQPQYVWRNFRIDFRISVMCEGMVEPFQFFVECDGHEFHERTKEQAERDRSRDREIQSANIPILRFTGSEIYRNPFVCVDEILKFGLSKTPVSA